MDQRGSYIWQEGRWMCFQPKDGKSNVSFLALPSGMSCYKLDLATQATEENPYERENTSISIDLKQMSKLRKAPYRGIAVRHLFEEEPE